jgi:hypothetical protein
MKIKFLISLFILSIVKISHTQTECDCSPCIVINEFAVDPKDGENGNSSSTGEFIELYNTCDESVDIGCYVICLTDDTGGGRGDCITIPSGVTLAPGGVYTLGGYGTNCTGGETDCDWNGLTLDFNWHSNATEVWDVINDEFFTTNSGKYIGVLLDGGEEITLFNSCGNNIDGVTYSNGSGVYSTTENIDAVNGCDAKSITIDTDDVTNLGSTPGGSTADEGWQRQCDGTWSFTQFNDQTAGTPDNCTLNDCVLPMNDLSLYISAEDYGLYNKLILKKLDSDIKLNVEHSTDMQVWKLIHIFETTYDVYHHYDFDKGVNYYRVGIKVIGIDNSVKSVEYDYYDVLGRKVNPERKGIFVKKVIAN